MLKTFFIQIIILESSIIKLITYSLCLDMSFEYNLPIICRSSSFRIARFYCLLDKQNSFPIYNLFYKEKNEKNWALEETSKISL